MAGWHGGNANTLGGMTHRCSVSDTASLALLLEQSWQKILPHIRQWCLHPRFGHSSRPGGVCGVGHEGNVRMMAKSVAVSPTRPLYSVHVHCRMHAAPGVWCGGAELWGRGGQGRWGGAGKGGRRAQGGHGGARGAGGGTEIETVRKMIKRGLGGRGYRMPAPRALRAGEAWIDLIML